MNASSLGALTRRASLSTLSAIGLFPLAGSPTAAAKRNKDKRKKINKKARKKCRQQIDPCLAVLESECSDDPDCLACCEFAGECDFAGLVACVNDVQAGGER